MSGSEEMSKQDLRQEVTARRATRTPAELALAGMAIASHAESFAALAGAKQVACYLSMGSEPDTSALISSLWARHIDVRVPIALPDRSMQWADFGPRTPTTTSRLGIAEPNGERRDSRSLAECQIAIIPALAVDHRGQRLGRGAGYYDRALADYPGIVIAVVFDDEIFESIPAEDHDRPVDHAFAPSGIVRF